MLSGHVHLVSLAQWDALPETSEHTYELVEGVIRVVPGPPAMHQRASARLAVWLDAQLPAVLSALCDVEVVLDREDPATVRVPDIIVTRTALAETNPARFGAADVVLAIEVQSAGTRRTDRVTKLAEYADAGIPHYWLVEISEPATITTLRLDGQHYVETQSSTATLTVTEPAALTVDVPRLLTR